MAAHLVSPVSALANVVDCGWTKWPSGPAGQRSWSMATNHVEVDDDGQQYKPE